MLKSAQNKTDLMALLGQVNASAGKKDAGAGLGALGKLLEGHENKNEFSQILASEGALEEISAEDLLSFFKEKSGDTELTGEEQLLKKFESGEGKDLLKSLKFDGQKFIDADGQEIKPQDIVSKLSQESQIQKKTEVSALRLNSQTEALTESENLKTTDGPRKAPKENIKSAEDFLAQRKALHGKRVVADASGTPRIQRTNAAVNHYQKENKIVNDRLIKVARPQVAMTSSKSEEIKATKGSEVKTLGSDFIGKGSQVNSELAQILSQSDRGDSGMQMASKEANIVNLSQIQSTNKTELVNQVSNYIEQAYVAGQDSIDLVVNHDELGQFRINATKSGPGQQVDLEIQTLTGQGQQFFAENETELLKSLTQNGVKVSDFKLVGQKEFLAFGENRSQMNDQGGQSQGRGEFSQNSQQGQRQFSSERDQGRERRQQMWQQAQEQMMSA